MNENSEHPPCSIMNCARPGIHDEIAESEHWTVSIFYCDEHQREIDKGVPLGPVGVDPSRLIVEPVGTVELRTGGVILASD